MKLLVGYDGSQGGRDALELARVLGGSMGASALVVTVLPYGRMPIPYALLGDGEAAEAEPLFEQARRALEGIEVRTRAYGASSPAAVLNDLAEKEEVDTIVIGSPHRGTIGRALIGSVAEGLLHGAPCDVVTAPRGYAEERHERLAVIGVAYDGTPESKVALDRAQQVGRANRSTLRIFTVSEPPVAVPGVAGYTPPIVPDADRVLAEGVKAVEFELGAEGRELSGPAASVLAEACEEGVDLLVVGSRGYGPVMRVLLGSVSTKLIHLAPCPVLVVPRP